MTALALAERSSLRIAIGARLLALFAVQLWLAISIPATWTIFYHLWLALFFFLGLAQLLLMVSRFDSPWHKFLFASLDGLLLAMLLMSVNPLLAEQPPPALSLRYANTIFIFVFLAGAAFTYNPALVLCTGGGWIMARTIGLVRLIKEGDVLTSTDPAWRDAASLNETIRLFLRPDFVHLNIEGKKLFVVALVTVLLALVVTRTRRLVQSQVAIERARTNLARYFSPNLVERLAGHDEPLGAVRRQPVAVLFADIQGFTAFCEKLPPEQVVAMLRAFHERMERAIFDHGGTLDKYMGDGLMATFGTPMPGERDASRALAAARAMLVELDVLNQARRSRGEAAIAIGIGLHYGPVVQGDIGGGQRLEFTVLGDTVNVAARLERMTRTLGTPLVVSGDLIDRLAKEDEPSDLAGLVEGEAADLRGREARLPIWTLGRNG